MCEVRVSVSVGVSVMVGATRVIVSVGVSVRVIATVNVQARVKVRRRWGLVLALVTNISTSPEQFGSLDPVSVGVRFTVSKP